MLSCLLFHVSMVTPDNDDVDFPVEIPQKKPLPNPRLTPPTEKKPEREVRVRLSITETDIVVVEDLTSASSNAVVLKVSW